MDNLASQIATFVTQNGFDGVDIDFEDTSGFDGTGGYDGVDFLTQLTDDLYSQLPKYQNIITHAPQTPYWLQNYNYQYPPYAQLYWNSGTEIAWFNNQTYSNCLNGGNTDCTAQDKIADYVNIVNSDAVPPTQLVVGVIVAYCGTTDNNGNCTGDGYIPFNDPSGNGNDVATVISQLSADYQDKFGGVMGWNYTLDLQCDSGSWSQNVSSALEIIQPNWVGYNAQSGLCLDSNYNAFNLNVYADGCNATQIPSQSWNFRRDTLVDSGTGLCLDSNYSGNVYTDSCNGGNYQNWQFFGSAIRNRQTGLCLDSDINGSVYTDACNGGNSQNWFPGLYW